MKKQKQSNESVREIFYIIKNSMLEYSLMRMEYQGSEVVINEVVKKDTPLIVYAKLMEKLRQQKVG